MSQPTTEVSPAERTVGQLIADAIKLYGHRFWRGLGLGIPAAAFTIGASFLDGGARVGYGLVVGPFALALSYVWAVAVATGARNATGRALLAGAIAFLPLAASRVLVFTGVYFVALAWFALVGLAVPSVLVEGRGLRDALQHGLRLARADFVHAFGTVAALAIVVIVSIFSLSLLLAGFGAQSITDLRGAGGRRHVAALLPRVRTPLSRPEGPVRVGLTTTKEARCPSTSCCRA